VRAVSSGTDPFAVSRLVDAALPARRQLSSDHLGWSGALVRTYLDRPETTEFETRPSSGPLLVLALDGISVIESRHGGRWHRAVYHPGSIGLTAPGRTSVLRWRSQGTTPLQSVHIHLAPALFEAFADDHPGPAGRPGSNGANGSKASAGPDALMVDDPVLSTLAGALEWALRSEAPALYADAAAQMLVTQLVVRRPRCRCTPSDPGLRPDTLATVTDYLHAHLADDVSLEDLSVAARLSKHHLLRRFKASTGDTPHQFLTRLRMQRAAVLLRTTSRPVGLIAADCGYRNVSRFGSAFRRHHGTTPGRYRSNFRTG
jgi:AraC family transcriptional regulator